MVICTRFSPHPVLPVPWVLSLSCVIVPPVVRRWRWRVLWSSKHPLSTLRAVARSGGGGCRVPLSSHRPHRRAPSVVIWGRRGSCPCSSSSLSPIVLPWPLLASPIVLSLFCLGFFVTPLIPQHLPSSFCRPAVARRPHRCSPIVFAFPRCHCSRLCGCVGRQSRRCE
jgi:hypothetical protein